MSYRDDRDADRARIEALEAELATARRRIDELEGRRSEALVLASSAALLAKRAPDGTKLPWYGAPLKLELTRTFTGEYPRDAFEDIVEVARAVTRDTGRTELLRSSMTWSSSSADKSLGPFIGISVVVKDGRTTVTATDRLGQLAGGLYGGLFGGVAGGGIAVPIFSLLSVPVLIPVGLAVWLGGGLLGTRAIFKRAARRRAEQLQQAFEAVCAEVGRQIVAPPP